MQKSKFTKYIKSLNEEELQEELDRLFTKIPEVKAYYSLELGTDADRKRIYDKVKKDLASKYKTKSYARPRRPRIMKINAILRDVEKHSVYTFELGDIFLYNAECASHFAREYQFLSDPLINVLLNSYEKASLYIRDALMEDEYKERFMQVQLNVSVYPWVAIELERIYERHFD